MRFIVSFVILTLAVWASAETILENKASYILCKNGVAVRTIRVERKGHEWLAYYTKEGIDKEVGKSGTSSLCFDISGKIRKNLEAASWKCKDISDARVSSLVGE